MTPSEYEIVRRLEAENVKLADKIKRLQTSLEAIGKTVAGSVDDHDNHFETLAIIKQIVENALNEQKL